MSSGGSRVSIPSSVRKTIQDIKEIAGKHSDEDIYAMLKECSMDPNETAQKLLYLDTFHEVKRKRDRRKENVNRKSEDSRPMFGAQGRGARGGWGSYSSQYLPLDARGGRNMAARKENGVYHSTGKGSMLVSQKAENKAAPNMAKSSALTVNGPKSVSNGSYSQHSGPQASVAGGISPSLDSLVVDANKTETAPPLSPVDVKQPSNSTPLLTSTFVSGITEEQGKSPAISNHQVMPVSASGVYSSASDPVGVPSPKSRLSGAAGAIGRDVGSPRVAAESNHIQINKHVPQNVDDSEPICKKAASGTADSLCSIPNQLQEVDKRQILMFNFDSQLSPQHSDTSKVVTSENTTVAVEASSQSLPEHNVSVLEEKTTNLHLSDVHHVIFPNHFQVPEAFKSGLTFGSFDGSHGLTSKYSNGASGEKASISEVDSFQANDETAREPSLSNQSVSSTAQDVDYPDHPQSPEHLPENVTPSEDDVSSSAGQKFDQLKQETLLLPGGPQFPVVQTAPNCGLGFMPHVLGSQLVPYEGSEPQARLPNFASGNSLVLSTSVTTVPATQPAGVAQSSIPVSPQPVPVFRQAYPPNYLPYSHYFSPYFVPPVHQFLSHGGFPQQPSTGSVYLPPTAASPGVKYSLPQYKPGTNPGNQTQVGIPSGYGSFSSSPLGYSLSPAVTSGNSTGNEDHAASHLKDNNMYTVGQQNEGSAVWIPTPGREISSLQANSFYNLPQGQHVTFSPAQASHAAFAGLYHPAQTMAAPSAVHPLLQQSQGMSGSIETVGHPLPSGSYQQPQGAQMNWNASY